MTIPTTALITGASTGIGAVYADRLAHRGHNLVLVARDADRLSAVATRLRDSANVTVEILQADLTAAADLARVEGRLREDASINLLVNNAGAAAQGGFEAGNVAAWESLILLNVMALTRLTGTALPGFLARGDGAIINIASVVALAPELPMGVYGATKSYVLALSQALQAEFGTRLYVQAVLPAATRTEIWERSGRNVNEMKGVMDVQEMVDAALVGFDRRELITIPPLPEAEQWTTFNAARQAMLPNFSQEHAAARYRS